MPTSTHIVDRIAASLLGGWVFVWGFATLTIGGQVALGRPCDEAHTATMRPASAAAAVAAATLAAKVGHG